MPKTKRHLSVRKKARRIETVTLSHAKTFLGRLADRAAAGEVIYISRGARRFVLQVVPEIEPIPMRPPGYFADAYTKADIAEMNQLAKSSVIKPPRDLE